MRFAPPDWSIYAIILGVILLRAMGSNNEIAPIEPPPLGPALADIRPSDRQVLVDIGPRHSGSGTAFSIDGKGMWLTARHVVDSCDRLGLIAGPNMAVKVDDVEISKDSDTAVLHTRWNRAALPTDLSSRRRLQEPGYFFGFPQGRPGEVAGSLMGRHQLITRGRYNAKEAVLVWSELGRTRGLKGSLGGLSGAPVLDADGEVIGIVAAESPRRGRVYTVAPSSVRPLVPSARKPLAARAIALESFGQEADVYRRDRRIAQVICLVD
ncbi:MAG: serine protease [Robiginitomaculum sp.]